MELATTFFGHFYQQIKLSGILVDLLIVRKKRGESLFDFMTRFTMESLRFQCTEDTLFYPAFLNGLLAVRAYTELCHYLLKMVQECGKSLEPSKLRMTALDEKGTRNTLRKGIERAEVRTKLGKGRFQRTFSLYPSQ